MSELWVPPGVRPQSRAVLPDGDVRLSDGLLLKLDGGASRLTGARVWRATNGLSVIGSVDSTRRHGPLLHVSVAHSARDPKWEELVRVRDAFFPNDVDCMMVMPRAEDYVSLHPHCFHVWETPVAWGIR